MVVVYRNMEPEKEQWIRKVMGSLDNVQRAEPNPFLFTRIEQRLQSAPPAAYVSTRLVWLVAASFGLLVFLNAQLIRQRQSTPDNGSLNTVVSDMQLYPTANLYDVWSGLNY